MNNGGTVVANNPHVCMELKDRMDIYDSLDPVLRKILQNAPFALTVIDSWVNRKIDQRDIPNLERRLKEMQVKSTTATYGSNHPQAKI